MSISKAFKKFALEASVAVSLGIGILTSGNFYFHHNVNYEVDGTRIFKKADGILAHTEVEINKDDSVKMNRYSFGNTRFYTEKDGDGKVDRIFQSSKPPFVRGSHSQVFYRNEHLEQYPQVFERADKDFRQQMKRFKPYIN